MQAQINFYDELERRYDDARGRLQGIKQELGSYEKIMTLLKDHINDNLNIQKRLLSPNSNNNLGTNNNNNSSNIDSERKQAIVKESYDKLQAKYERFRQAKVEREDEYKRQLSEKIQLEGHLNSMKTQIANIKKLQEAQEEQLKNSKQESVFDYDVETINILNECNWNLGDSCDRSLAETLLSCFPSGTFLVRSSKTNQNCYALSVVANSIVRHCLIDKIGEEYCFHPPGPQRQTYPSLCNLVMDYRHKSLLRHNPELNTNLIYPVLSQLKKTSKGSSGTAQ